MSKLNVVKTYQLFLNTRSADSGTSNNCTFIVNPPISVSHTNNRFQLGIKFVELPYTFNQLNSDWVTLSIIYNGTPKTLTLSVGNYNINDLITELITQIIASGLGLLSTNFSFIYSQPKAKVSFAMVGTGANVMTFNFGSNMVLGSMFGCPSNISFTTTAVVSPNKIDVNPVSSVFIRSNSIKTATAFEAINTLYKTTNIFAKIPINTLPNSIIYFRNDFPCELITNQTIDTINLFLTDNLSNNVLDLSGVNYGLMILIEEIEGMDFQESDRVITRNTLEPMVSERDKILNELIQKKLELTKQLKNKNVSG
jgi:hypothetical protein